MWKRVFIFTAVPLAMVAVAFMRFIPIVPIVPLVAEMNIKTTLVSPIPTEDEFIDVSALERVNLTFDVRNVGTLAVTGLAIPVLCQCQIKSDPLAEALAPGQSSRVTVQITAPPAGIAQRSVPVISKITGETLAELTVRLRVPVQAPSWLDGPRAAAFTFVEGRPASGELRWEAIERPESPSWMSDLKILPNDLGEVSHEMEERPWGEDRQYCVRRYRVHLKVEQPNVGRKTGNLVVMTNPPESDTASVPVFVEVVPALSVIPTRIVLRHAGLDSQSPLNKVTVIQRAEGMAPPDIRFDESLIRMTPHSRGGSGPLMFDIAPIGAVTRKMQTDVVFASEGFGHCTLAVELIPD